MMMIMNIINIIISTISLVVPGTKIIVAGNHDSTTITGTVLHSGPFTCIRLYHRQLSGFDIPSYQDVKSTPEQWHHMNQDE